jgi:hypothetical protein
MVELELELDFEIKNLSILLHKSITEKTILNFMDAYDYIYKLFLNKKQKQVFRICTKAVETLYKSKHSPLVYNEINKIKSIFMYYTRVHKQSYIGEEDGYTPIDKIIEPLQNKKKREQLYKEKIILLLCNKHRNFIHKDICYKIASEYI